MLEVLSTSARSQTETHRRLLLMDFQGTILLVDNGSSRAQSTLSLRRLAAALGERLGRKVQPVSLMHANRVPAEELGGRPADTFEPFLRREAAAGRRDLLVLPLFFGPSRALSELVPEKVAAVSRASGPVRLQMADVLCPLPGGEPRLSGILHDNLRRRAAGPGLACQRVVLVDHGSPIPQVTAVRSWLAGDLAGRLGPGVRLLEAVMERRTGAEYDFNGDLLEDLLHGLAAEDSRGPVLLAMLFLFAGRHAGPGGDVEQICRSVEREHPGFRVHQSPLISDHPAIIDILESRYRSAVQRGAA
jgi:sirohydrochlorin ferrochelatase